MIDLVTVYANNSMNQILEPTSVDVEKMMTQFHELQDHAALVITLAEGCRVIEHVRLDRTLNVFSVYEIKEASEGCALDALSSVEMADFKANTPKVYVTGSDTLAALFYLQQIRSAEMLELNS